MAIVPRILVWTTLHNGVQQCMLAQWMHDTKRYAIKKCYLGKDLNSNCGASAIRIAHLTIFGVFYTKKLLRLFLFSELTLVVVLTNKK